MGVLILSQEEVQRLLTMEACIEVMASALMATSRGEAVLPLRTMVWKPDKTGLIGLMPAYLGDPASFGLKLVSIFPGNHGTEFDSHQGAVMLFDVRHGSLMAVMDASSITAIRTAAVSGVATRALAREDAGDLAILGSGVEAITHLAAMKEVRKLRRVRVWSRNPESARRFAAGLGPRHGLTIEAMPSARAAVEGADLICTTTAAREPVLEGAWLSPGTHINAVGACFAASRELDTAAVARARLIVDRRESALAEAGDFLIPRAEGAFGDEHIAGELGGVLLGRLEGRRGADEVTLFKSNGLAFQDAVTAALALERAKGDRVGTEFSFG